MASMSQTTFANMLKVLYPKGPEYLLYGESPFVEWLPKSKSFTNEYKQVNPVVSGIRGATTAATASAAKSTPSHYKFLVPRVKDYVFGSIEEETIMASENEPSAIAKAVDVSIRAGMYEFGRSLARHVWGTGGGAIGEVGSVSGNDVVLANASDVVHFELGMEVQASATDGTSGSLRDSGDACGLTGIDPSSLTLTSDSTWTTDITGITAGDYLFREGDFGAVCTGVRKWIPQLGSSVGTLHGVDRSVFTSRLGGTRVAGSGKDPESVIFDAQAENYVAGGRSDTLWVGARRYANVMKSLHSKATYEMMGGKKKAQFGFDGICIPGQRGTITIYSDPNCPDDYGLLTKRESWDLASLGGLPHFAGKDGLKFLRESASDSVEWRLKAYFNLCNERPIDSCAIGWDLSTVA